MKVKAHRLMIGVFAAATMGTAQAESKPESKAESKPESKTESKARFEQLKALAGEWTGKAGKGDGPAGDARVMYRLTAGGSAVMETLFPGTPHEMVTVYYLDGEDLMLTHYCAGGNQPRMRAERGADGKRLAFRFLDGTNLKPEKQSHMHEATLRFLGPDHIQSEWVSYENGRPAGTAKFDLTRKK